MAAKKKRKAKKDVVKAVEVELDQPKVEFDPVKGKPEEKLELPPPAEIPAYKVNVPQEHMPLIVGIERAIEKATTLKATKALAKEVGVPSPSKYRNIRDIDRCRAAIREQIGIKIGEQMHREFLERAEKRPEEQTLGELAAKEMEQGVETTKRQVKACECIPEWLEALRTQEYDPEAHASMLTRHRLVIEEIGEDGTGAAESSPVWDSDLLGRLHFDLFDTLNELAPKGMYYGANERGLGEWGFWEHYLAVPHPEVVEVSGNVLETTGEEVGG